MMTNLTNLANVKQWVNQSTTDDDTLLTRLIAEASRTTLNFLQRPDIGATSITETISGKNTAALPLRNWPVVSVSALSINNVVVPASTGPTAYGYALQEVYGGLAGKPQMLGIVGSVCNAGGGWPNPYGYYGQSPPVAGSSGARPFGAGVSNILVTYLYGYAIASEPGTIPGTSAYTITPAQPYGMLTEDNGVSYADGSGALVAVAGPTPTAGQYVPPKPFAASPSFVYTFAAADAGKAVLLNYDYVPSDIEQAVIEMVGERYRYRERIGQASRSLGGQETASYMVRDGLTASIKQRLQPYKIAWAGG